MDVKNSMRRSIIVYHKKRFTYLILSILMLAIVISGCSRKTSSNSNEDIVKNIQTKIEISPDELIQIVNKDISDSLSNLTGGKYYFEKDSSSSDAEKTTYEMYYKSATEKSFVPIWIDTYHEADDKDNPTTITLSFPCHYFIEDDEELKQILYTMFLRSVASVRHAIKATESFDLKSAKKYLYKFDEITGMTSSSEGLPEEPKNENLSDQYFTYMPVLTSGNPEKAFYGVTIFRKLL